MSFFNHFFDERDPEKAVKENFSFLVEQYGFTYTPYCYTSEKAKITLELGHKSPRIFVYYLGEPDFTRLIFERIIQYFENRVLDIYFPDYSLEHNIEYMANLLKGYMPKIVDQIDEWWVPVQLFQYRLMEESYRKSGQLDSFLASFKTKHDYLKSKGVI